MARPIESTPEINTQEDLDRFLENMEKPASDKKIKLINEAKEMYKKLVFIDELP
ncbi:hypothetical protein PXD04_10720 [Methanosphaera sp. ISO3-F5]|uniref:hypothetical protein n=1 Tax=Methanosphaera sp. ISO3-F5 TaxID=1452353 RepID=UPI002B261DA4|nr:hypothetical protein [Methanosphaera sp. ISO3-F5]WQH64165.1 hypothetical protein PXD04_10720 [Methanosphaera sp. ISO3-F5]